MKKDLTNVKRVDGPTSTMQHMNHLSSCKRARRKRPGSCKGQVKPIMSLPPRQVSKQTIHGKRSCQESGIKQTTFFQPPKKKQKCTAPQLSKRPKKRRHQARDIESNDSDDERQVINIPYKTKDSELNVTKNIESSVDEDESYGSDMVER